ncbi:multiheme c-type cytochrome [Chrysiogenes arsenatis]|uniref:multiheme c-type cytochrome n=1 Tax=Chrysiogenes arsenatis TaxID=309797 RepID=UPI00041FA221|nr:cytochrome c3 family protein [Chrysiogenes arsenatis]
MIRLLTSFFFVAVLFAANSFAYDCSTCHKNELTGADKNVAHAKQLQGLDKMTNPMHMGLKSCVMCHDKAALATAKDSSASLNGGSREALGGAPACMGCHNPAGIPAPHVSNWDWDRIKGHTFSIPK